MSTMSRVAARPRKSASERRDKIVQLCLTAEEYELVRRACVKDDLDEVGLWARREIVRASRKKLGADDRKQ
jgi:hypothetical protein